MHIELTQLNEQQIEQITVQSTAIEFLEQNNQQYAIPDTDISYTYVLATIQDVSKQVKRPKLYYCCLSSACKFVSAQQAITVIQYQYNYQRDTGCKDQYWCDILPINTTRQVYESPLPDTADDILGQLQVQFTSQNVE